MPISYNFYVIFPCSKESMCEFIVERIRDTFEVNCESITYKNHNIDTNKINEILREECILIIGYEGDISYVNFYKLGMAHAKEKIVILINILSLRNKHSYKENPQYIRKHFTILFWINNNYRLELEKIVQRLEDIIQVILINDLSNILYQKAINLCNILEEITNNSNIKKLNQDDFKSRLSKYEKYLISNNKNLLNIFLQDDRSLRKILFECICEDKYERMEIEEIAKRQQETQSTSTQLLNNQELPTSRDNSTFNINTLNIRYKPAKTMSNTINQFGSGDNIAGDKVMGNKIDTQINNSQNLAQAAKDIKELLDQLDKDYDRNTLTGQAMINAKAIEAIDKNPRLKDRIVNALKEGGSSALEELVDYPAIKILVATLKGFIDVK